MSLLEQPDQPCCDLTMTGLFNLRTRLALGIALIIGLALGTVYFLSHRLSQDLASSGTKTDLRVTESRLVATWDREREAMVGKVFEAAYDPANAAQLRAGGAQDFLLRLTLTLGFTNAWLVNNANEVVAQAGSGQSLAASKDALELARRAMSIGRADGVVTMGEKASIVAAVRINNIQPKQVLFVSRPIDGALARQMSEVNGSQLAFVKFAAGSAVVTLGELVDQDLKQPLAAAVAAVASVGVQTGRDIELGDRTGRLRLLHQGEDGNIYAAVIPNNTPVGNRIEEFSRYVGSIAALALALALGAGLLFGSRLTRALADLSAAARQVGNGRYDVEVKVGARDELGRYVESFNLLAQSLKQRESKMLQSAHRDTVTGMPSRPLFENQLVDVVTKARSSSGNMTLITVVVDRLREVTDSLGRKAGDSMLAEIADRIRRSLRTREQGSEINVGEGSYIARLGTYEFGVIVPDCDATQAAGVANKLADVVSRRVEYEGQSVLPGGRIGVAVFPEHGTDPGSLLYSADIAASHAQSELSRIAMFDPSYEQDRERQLAMMGELRQALENDELHIVMQPKITLNKQGTLMAEALMRWEHPERGPQNPAEFVPFAEKTGFITQLTNWMIDGALSIAADWMAQGVPLGVSVNLSPRDLGSPEFTTYVVERLRAHKLRGSALTLEVTEQAVMNATPVVKQNLDVLWRLGVRIAIDDFGSGFASLDQLRALPLSYIKVDRQYIRGLVNDEASRIVVKSAIDLGHSIGVEVVAEGVETAEQLELLSELGCDQAQGYFVAKPLPNAEFEQWVRNQSSKFGINAAQFMGEGAVVKEPEAVVPLASIQDDVELPPADSGIAPLEFATAQNEKA